MTFPMRCSKEQCKRNEDALRRVRELLERSRVAMSRGCLCYGNECSGICGSGKPLAWDLDPDAVLRALDGDSVE